MRDEDIQLAQRLRRDLRYYSRQRNPLPGIEDPPALQSFVFQLVESVRRVRFVQEIAKRSISPERQNPKSELFDPIRAAIRYKSSGSFEEACWLVFLFTHFGKNKVSGYRLLRDVYGKLGADAEWTWEAIRTDPASFRHWLDTNLDDLRSGAVHRAFGNHRKYQSLDAWKRDGTGAAVQSYVSWVQSAGSHELRFNAAVQEAGTPELAFRTLYRSMSEVRSFGRTAKFDYLSMVGKLDLAPIKPDSVYFGTATGPVRGAKLLFFGAVDADQSIRHLERAADDLADYLKKDKQIMEDSLCNWQKSPLVPIRFRG